MRTSHLAKGGILVALSLILIYLSSILPINKLYLLGIASCIIPLSILMTDMKNAVVVYVAVSLLSFFLIPSKGISLIYILFFGIYGFVKYYVEKLRKVPIEILLKFSFFNSAAFFIFYLYKSLLLETLPFTRSMYITIAALQVMFLVYDYAMTVFINQVEKRFSQKI